jgi:choline-phosphate cytidylyltransferase
MAKKRHRRNRQSQEDDDPSLLGYSADRPARIYCDGIFDMFHYGHAKALEQAKKLRPYVYLMVGVCNDALTHEKKGKTVMNEYERYESVRYCKWVDEVIPDAPWCVDQEFIDLHNIDFVAHDDIPYTSGDVADVYQFVKDQGKFLATQRTDGISTSDLITRILKDYDMYVRRNLERGISAKELNLSLLKKGEWQVRKKVQAIRGAIKENWTGAAGEALSQLESLESKSHQWIKDWEAKSKDWRKGFIELFDPNGPVGKIIFPKRIHGTLSEPTLARLDSNLSLDSELKRKEPVD